MAGFYQLTKHFGRSLLLRTGSVMYLQWQRKKYGSIEESNKSFIKLTKEQYDTIGDMLGEPTEVHVDEARPIGSPRIGAYTYKHFDRKTYIKIRRYLIKQELIRR